MSKEKHTDMVLDFQDQKEAVPFEHAVARILAFKQPLRRIEKRKIKKKAKKK
ncbi:hypothetical protein KAU37_12030 [Candidatus Bipolaricaulota bacterium]|nr:hypothetical protein [Candidatus Bipolaricaulota bacterium]